MSVRWEGQGRAVVGIAGELDIATASHARQILLDAVRAYRQVIVDCARLDFCDCAGLSVLIAAHNAAHAHSTLLLLRRVPSQLGRLLHRVPHRLHIAQSGLPGAPMSTSCRGGS
ncbi:STAS domain-containing protein [Streptomyces sp. TX20-6-3]|uniref:STAS domain-containing protein n=1 Tax=Streptomyces sp. TX20-6-3 TaxID=3028705 RepID=UPI0029BD59F2|nr:STAS domain-containing protein [Streptomyces sp. TX20-6-3]MDX2565398.1 STAS domain-containing protein [Streptomyces sp. TX20-6-3]